MADISAIKLPNGTTYNLKDTTARNAANSAVPNTRTVNGKALSSNISLGAGDVGAYTKKETDTKINAAIASAYKYKGSVTADKLPTSGQVVGDVYNITNDSSYGKAGMNVAWTGTTWDALGSNVDLSNYVTTSDSRLSNARPASDVYAWAKAASKPSYSWNEINGKPSTFVPSSHTHTKDQVGLGSVANLDQSKAIKSITRNGTTFTATALDGTTSTFTQQDTNTTYGLATSSADGLMSAADKKAIDREFFRMLPKGGTYIPAKADLNSIQYLKVGNYYNSLSADVKTMKNCPGGAFMMYVLSPLSEAYDNESTRTWVYRLRIFVEHTGTIFTQLVSSDTTAGNFSYGPWVKMTNSNDLGAVSNTINTHIANKANPHGVTKAQVGLGNVDNTADADKSVKYAASAGSANAVAWGNVSGKPSTYTPSAHTHTSIESVQLTNQDLNDYKSNSVQFLYGAGSNTVANKPSGVDAFGVYTYRSAQGFYTQELVDTNGTKYLRICNSTSWTAWKTIVDSSNVAGYKVNNAGYADSAGKATNDSAGQNINTTYIKNLAVSGRTITYTKGNGATGTITTQDTNTTYGVASQSSNGLMSAADKKAVDREFFRMLPKGGTVIPNGANLNSTAYLKVGNYYQSAIANTTNMTNIPIKSAFMMYVLSPLSGVYDNESTAQWVYRLRIFVEYTGNNIFVQFVSSGSTPGSFTYDPWVKITNSNDLGAVRTKLDNLSSALTEEVKLTIPVSGWSSNTTAVNGTDYYTYSTTSITGISNPHPTIICSSASGVLPSAEERMAFDNIYFVTVDTSSSKITFYAPTKPKSTVVLILLKAHLLHQQT